MESFLLSKNNYLMGTELSVSRGFLFRSYETRVEKNKPSNLGPIQYQKNMWILVLTGSALLSLSTICTWKLGTLLVTLLLRYACKILLLCFQPVSKWCSLSTWRNNCSDFTIKNSSLIPQNSSLPQYVFNYRHIIW